MQAQAPSVLRSELFRSPAIPTRTGLPLIGAVPGLDNVFAVMGFGGNGVTFSQIAAEMISAEIAGRRDADADLFAFRNVTSDDPSIRTDLAKFGSGATSENVSCIPPA